MTDSALQPIEKSPIEVVNKEQLEAAINRMRVVVADGAKMNTAQLAVIAQESILARTMPGRDVHYFLDQNGNLKRSDDYKYLVAWATQRERYLTGDPEANFDTVFSALSEEEKLKEGISPNDFAVYCTITTKRDRAKLREEIKGFIALGIPAAEAVKLAREVLGEVGVKAVGVVNANDAGGNKIAKGWSPLQKARKLALKNAIHQKWGVPTIDDMQDMARKLPRIETIEGDWEDVPIDIPQEAQARQVELNAMAREARNIKPEEQKERLVQNVTIIRGEAEEVGIGEDEDWARFVAQVKENIPYYTGEIGIKKALKQLGLVYDPENEELLFDGLANYAEAQADIEAAN